MLRGVDPGGWPVWLNLGAAVFVRQPIKVKISDSIIPGPGGYARAVATTKSVIRSITTSNPNHPVFNHL